MRAIAINETLSGVLALTCAVAVFLATAFDAHAGLGPAETADSPARPGTSAAGVSP